MQRGLAIIYSDNNSSAQLIEAIIEPVTPHIIRCSTIEQTITACHSEEPKLVIILSVRPFINGRELVANIHTRNARKPVIYVISWQQSERIVLSLLECGVDQYITFPICISRLRGKVENELKTSVRL